MAGSVLVFLAIAGGAVFLAAALRRRVAETVPLSVLFLIAHTYLCAQLGLLRFSVYVSVFGMIGLGVAGGYLSLRHPKRWAPRWDISLLYFGLGLIWVLYISQGRLPLLQEEYTQWALMAKEMFYTGSLTPAAGTLFYAPAMAVFQTVFQVCNALFVPGDGFADWLLYAAYGTACLALLLPLVTVSHPKRWVRAGYALLFFLAAVCLPLHAFDLFSALNPDGFLAVLAAASLWAAVRDKSVPQAIIVGGYLFVLALAKDAGVFLALGVLAAYLVTLVRAAAYRQANGKRRVVLIAVPVAALVLARLLWPHLSVTPHGATPGMLALFWQSLTARVVSYRIALAAGGTTVFTVFSAYASFLFLTILLAGITALLLHSLRAEEEGGGPRAALWTTAALTVLYTAGLWLAYVFFIGAEDAAKLVNFQRLISVGYVLWGLIALATAQTALSRRKNWTWRLHLLTLLACGCVALAGSGALDTLTGRDFTAANEKYTAYYAVAEEAQRVIPQDARVYIVSQNDDGTRYNTLRYALCPRTVNTGTTWWLRDPEGKQNAWTCAVTPGQWQERLKSYDYVLVYQADDYLQTTIAQAVTADGVITANTLYRVDRDTGLLQALATDKD